MRQRLAQALQHAVVVDDQAEILAWIDTVRPGDGLHQRVGLHRLVDVERREALHVEAGQPHGADDGDAERMLRVLEGVSTSTRLPSAVSKPCFIRARCGMMSKPHFLKSATSFCASLMMISMIVSSSQSAWPRSYASLLQKRRVAPRSSALPPLPPASPRRQRAPAPAFACQRGMIRCYMRAQVILSMQTSIDLPDSQRVAQCSTKSAAILSSRSSAVMTS